jgi:hypothetical protein
MTTATVKQMITLYEDVARLSAAGAKLYKYPMIPFDGKDRDMLKAPLRELRAQQLRIGGLTSMPLDPLDKSATVLKEAIEIVTSINDVSWTKEPNENDVVNQLNAVVAELALVK